MSVSKSGLFWCELVGLFVIFAFWGTASAQIVNVQPLLASKDIDGLSGALEGTVDWRTGNSELFLLSGTLVARYRMSNHLIFFMAREEFGVQGGKRFIDKDFEHLRYRWEVVDAAQLETFFQHDRDQFRRLSLRALWGVGPRFPIVATKMLDVAIGVAYMLEFECLQQGSQSDVDQDQLLSHRLSTYGTVTLRLGDRVRLGETVYSQPRFDRPKDVRVLNETEMLVMITDRLSLKLTFSLAYDSEPPSESRALDTAMKTSLQLRL